MLLLKEKFINRKILFLICFVIAVPLTLTQAQEIKPYKIFLLGGQSNMDGCGTHEELPEKYQKHPENAVTWDQQIQEWVPLNEDSFATLKDNTHFNTEGQIKMGKNMAKAMLSDIR